MDVDQQPPSPARSIASVASTAFSERVAKVPAVIASKSKEELQQYVLGLLKKLKLRDKRVEELTAQTQGAGASTNAAEAGAGAAKEVAQLRAQLAAANARLQEAQKALAKSEGEVRNLVQSSRDSALVFEDRLGELQRQLSEGEEQRRQLERRAQEQQEHAAAVQQQLNSMREALKDMTEERETMFLKLGEHKETEAELRDQVGEVERQAAQQQAGHQAQLGELQGSIQQLQDELRRAREQQEEQGGQQALAELRRELDEARAGAQQLEEVLQGRLETLEHDASLAREEGAKHLAEVEAHRESVSSLCGQLQQAHVQLLTLREQCLPASLSVLRALSTALGAQPPARPAAQALLDGLVELMRELQGPAGGQLQQGQELQQWVANRAVALQALTEQCLEEASAAAVPPPAERQAEQPGPTAGSTAEELQQATAELEARVQELEHERERLQEMHDQVGQELAARMAQLADKERQIAAIHSAAQAAEAQLEEAEERAATNQQLLNQLSEVLQGHPEGLAAMRAKAEQAHELHGQVLELQGQVEELKQALLTAAADDGQSAAGNDVEETPQGRVKALEEELELVRAELRSRGWQVDELQQRNRELIQQLLELQDPSAGLAAPHPAAQPAAGSDGGAALEGGSDGGVAALAAPDTEPAGTGAKGPPAKATKKKTGAGAKKGLGAVKKTAMTAGAASDGSAGRTTAEEPLPPLLQEGAGLEAARWHAARAEAQVQELKAALAEVAQRAQHAEGELTSTRRQLSEAAQKQFEAQQQLSEAQQRAAGTAKEAESERWKVGELQSSLKELQEELDIKAQALHAAHAELKKLHQQQQHHHHQHQGGAESGSIEAAARELEAAQAALTAQCTESQQLHEQVEVLFAQLAQARAEADALRAQLDAAGQQASGMAAAGPAAAEAQRLQAMVDEVAAELASKEAELACSHQRVDEAHAEASRLQALAEEAEAGQQRLRLAAGASQAEAQQLQEQVRELSEQLSQAKQQREQALMELQDAQDAAAAREAEQQEAARAAEVRAALQLEQLQQELAEVQRQWQAAEAAAAAAASQQVAAVGDPALALPEAEMEGAGSGGARSQPRKAPASPLKQRSDSVATVATTVTADGGEDGTSAGGGGGLASVGPSEAVTDATTLVADHARLAKELADTKKRFLALAKKKSAEHATAVKALEAQLAGLQADAEALRTQLAAREQELTRMQAQHAQQVRGAVPEVQARAERLEAAQALAAKDKELAASQALLSEYKQLSAQREASAASALSRLEDALKKASLDKELAVSKVEGRLRERDEEVESLRQQLNRAEAALASARAESANAQSGSNAELATCKAEAEASKADAQAARKELEGERGRLTKALDEAKKRLAKATKAQHTAELAAAEARGKSESERERHVLELALAHQSANGVRRDVERLEAELRDYKSRAQMLVRTKDQEIKQLRDSAGSTTQADTQHVQALVAEVSELRAALDAAEAGRAAAEQQASAALAGVQAAHEGEVAALRGRMDLFQQAAADAGRQADELRNRCEALEARLTHHQGPDQQALLDAQRQLHEQAEALRAEVAAAKQLAAAQREQGEALLEAKDEEVLQLVRKVTLAQEEVSELRQHLLALQQQQQQGGSSSLLSSPLDASHAPGGSGATPLQNSGWLPSCQYPHAPQHQPQHSSSSGCGWQGGPAAAAGAATVASVGGSGPPQQQGVISTPEEPTTPMSPLTPSAHLANSSHPAAGGDREGAPAGASSGSGGGGEGSITPSSPPCALQHQLHKAQRRQAAVAAASAGGGGGAAVAEAQGTVQGAADILGALIEPDTGKQLLLAPGATEELLDADGLPVSLARSASNVAAAAAAAAAAREAIKELDLAEAAAPAQGTGGTATEEDPEQVLGEAERRQRQLEAQVVALTANVEVAKARVAELEAEVAELTKEVVLREEMETALKESLREAERAFKRQIKGQSHVDAEYLKNAVLKMYRTGEAEVLLPVFSTILSFSPDEMRSCKEGLRRIQEGEVPLAAAAAMVDSSISVTTNVISSLSSWTTWALGAGATTATAATPGTGAAMHVPPGLSLTASSALRTPSSSSHAH